MTEIKLEVGKTYQSRNSEVGPRLVIYIAGNKAIVVRPGSTAPSERFIDGTCSAGIKFDLVSEFVPPVKTFENVYRRNKNFRHVGVSVGMAARATGEQNEDYIGTLEWEGDKFVKFWTREEMEVERNK